MLAQSLFALAAFIPAAFAAPTQNHQIDKRALLSYSEEVTIHESCNVTQTRQLRKALADTYELTAFAQRYVYVNGPSDPIYQLYFGNGDPSVVVGGYENLMRNNKAGVLLRCDDIDGNCQQDGWRGHWRGENATSETVICDASYTDRKTNEQFCAFGYTVSQSSPSYYFSTDLMHRLFHIPSIGMGKFEHYADSFEDCIELAHHNATFAVYNTHSLQYFANHVYGVEVAGGGDSCVGPLPDHDHVASASSSVPVASATSAAAASSVAGSATATAAQSCHTHADGELHCV